MTTYFAHINTCHQVLGSKALGSLSFSEAASGGQPAPYHLPPQKQGVEG